MLVSNIKAKLEKVGAKVDISVEVPRWDGWNVTLSARIGQYYDVQIMKQVRRTNTVKTAEQALTYMLNQDVDHFSAKPWHDESDLASDYFAWNFYRRLKDIDRLAENAAENKREGMRLAPQ